MRYLVLLAILSLPMLAADKKKKPVVTTKTKVQVGTPASTNKSTSFGFGGLDRNNDGSLSRAEYLYNKNSAQGAEFDKLDTNKDGRLSRSEYR